MQNNDAKDTKHLKSLTTELKKKKLPQVPGKPVKDSDPDVEDWLMDMREHLHSIPSNDKKIE